MGLSGSNLQNFGDQIRYSDVNKFLTFPELNFIDIGVNDGESFVKLEAFADRLLAFKERSITSFRPTNGTCSFGYEASAD